MSPTSDFRRTFPFAVAFMCLLWASCSESKPTARVLPPTPTAASAVQTAVAATVVSGGTAKQPARLPGSAGGRRTTTQAVKKDGGTPYLERVELVTDQATGTGDGNGWGGNIPRIVRTSNGDIYSTVVKDGPDPYHRYWLLARRASDAGSWQLQTAPGSPGNNVYNPPSILRGPDDSINVVSWPNDRPSFWSSASQTDTPIPGNWYVNPTVPTGTLESTYGAAGIDSQGDVVVSQSAVGCNTCDHENTPGVLNWAHRDAGSSQWTFNSYIQDVRHAYMFLFVGLAHDLTMVGSADLRWGEIGFQKPAGSALNYVFDGIRAYEFPNLDAPPAGSTLIRQEPQDSGCLTPRAYATDVYEDMNGDVHVLYDLQGPDTSCTWTGHHAVLHNGQVVKDVGLSPGVPYSNLARIIQDTSGRFYIFSVGPPLGGGTACTVYLQRGTDADVDGTDLQPQIQLSLGTSDDCSTVQNNFIAAPRGGTDLADYVDGVVAANYGSHWLYYRIRLTGN